MQSNDRNKANENESTPSRGDPVAHNRLNLGIGTMFLFIGLIISLLLLVRSLQDSGEEQPVGHTDVESLILLPPNPVARVNEFVENIKQMPYSENRAAFIDFANGITTDGKVTSEEYQDIKNRHHRLQDEAMQDVSETPVEIEVITSIPKEPNN